MDIFLMIAGAVAVSVLLVYVSLRFDAWASGRSW